MELQTLQQLFNNYEELNDINNQLLIMALNPKDISPSTKKLLVNEYNDFSYQRLEFLGDAVLDLVIASLLYDYDVLKTPGDLTIIKSKIVNNKSLACFVKKICPFPLKRCADLFETLIAIVYLHTKRNLFFVERWLVEQWNILNIIDYMLLHPDQFDVCDAIDLANQEYTKYKSSSIKEKTIKYVKNEPIDFSYINIDDYTNEELQNILKAINQKLSKTKIKPYKTQLQEFYIRHKLTTPINYVVLNKPNNYQKYWQVGVICPLGLNCNNAIDLYKYKIIGRGQGTFKKEAEEIAAQETLNYLNKLLHG
jgi:dsRNA-specific ribonuclease